MLVFEGINALEEFKAAFAKENIKKFLCVCGKSCQKLPIFEEIQNSDTKFIIFDDFKPNPDISSAVNGIRIYRQNDCDGIIAIGGGSAIDVAKCIKLYIFADIDKPLIEQEKKENNIRLFAVPTTAGTGSEATRFSVVYYNGSKQSVTHDSIIPDYVLLEPAVLDNLPQYQRIVTAFDALSHAVESFWSVNSTAYSREISKEAIMLIKDNYEGYIANDTLSNSNMLKASNLAGQAINITQTTGGHAMSYKLTSDYGLAHGHAVAVSLIALWRFMEKEISKNDLENIADERGIEYLSQIFADLNKMITVDEFEAMVRKCGLSAPCVKSDIDSEVITLSLAINETRLKNNPIKLSGSRLEELYRRVFQWK